MSIYILLGSTFFITLIDYVCALVGNVLITKKLSVFDYGIYNFLNSISGLILTFFSFGLSQYNYKVIPGRDLHEQNKLIGNSLFIELIGSIFGVFLFGVIFKSNLIYSIGVFLFAVRICINALNNELIRCLGYRKQNLLKQVVSLINERGWLFFFLLLLFFNKLLIIKLDTILVCQFIGSFFVIVILLHIFHSKSLIKNFHFSWAFVKKHLKVSIAFVFVDLGMYLLEIGVRYVLFIKNRIDSIAYYSFTYNWISIIFKFGMLLVYILQPYFSNEYYLSIKNENHKKDRLYLFENFALKYSFYIIIFALVFFTLNYPNLMLALGKIDYLGTKRAFCYMIPLPIFMCLAYFFQILLVLAGKTKPIPVIYFIMVIGVIVSNYFFIEKYDYYSSSVIASASYFFLASAFFLLCPKNLFKFEIHARSILFFIVHLITYTVGLLVIIRFSKNMLLSYSIQIFFCFMIISVICFMNKEDFKALKAIQFS